MTPERETEIIREIKAGNYLLFEDIVAAYQDRLMIFIYRIVKDGDDARDICQDTFFKAYKSIKSFKGKSKFSTWLFKIGYRLSLNLIKKKKRLVEMDEKTVNSNPQASGNLSKEKETEELNTLVQNLMQQLPQKNGAALHLFYKEEKTYEEISAVMKLRLNTVKSLIFRGKNMIKQRLMQEHRLPVNS